MFKVVKLECGEILDVVKQKYGKYLRCGKTGIC